MVSRVIGYVLLHMDDIGGGLNGSTQHQLEVHLRQPRTLKSFASVKSNKDTTLYRFNEWRPGRAVLYGEALPNQLIAGCCIDRLNRQQLRGHLIFRGSEF